VEPGCVEHGVAEVGHDVDEADDIVIDLEAHGEQMVSLEAGQLLQSVEECRL